MTLFCSNIRKVSFLFVRILKQFNLYICMKPIQRVMQCELPVFA